MVKRVFFFFCYWKLLTLFFAYIGTFFLVLNPHYTPLLTFGFHQPYLLWVWGNFDGVHYLTIADHGYYGSLSPFFPLFPLLIRWFSYVFDSLPFLQLGLLVSNLAFLLALFFLLRLLKHDGYGKLQELFLLIIILFPTSFFYGSIYNDSLYLLLSTTCLYLARKRVWVASSIVGALATLARLNGLALFFFIIAEYLADDFFLKYHKRRLLDRIHWSLMQLFSFQTLVKKGLFSVLLIPGAFVGYLVYIQLTMGDWLIVFSSMDVWNQDKLTIPFQVVWRYIKMILFAFSFSREYFVLICEFLTACLYVLLFVYSFKKIRFSYLVFFSLSLLIPALTGTFQGMPRYGLHLYPFFLALTVFLSHRNTGIQMLYFLFSSLLLFVYLSLYTRGHFIA